MVRVENVRQDITRDIKVVDLQVSTADELPELGSDVDGIIIAAGSIVQIIQTGEWATLDSDGSWYDESGNEVS
jgi:hypothetical protein